MPICIDRRKTRATTFVMAAVEGFVGWILGGPRQHEADLLASLGTVSSAKVGETTVNPS